MHIVDSYSDIQTLLGKANRKKIAPNTWAERHGENMDIVLYNTVILSFLPNGCIDYYRGKEHATKLTLQRMNQFTTTNIQFKSTHQNIYMVKI